MKKIFITGGADYIGAVLVKKLLEQNYFNVKKMKSINLK